MSGLLVEVRSAGRKPQACGVARFIADNLDDEDRAAIDDVMPTDSGASTAGIYDALHRRGLTLLYNAVRVHRTGGCGCGRTS